MLLDPANPIARLVQEDTRYKPEAYIFVFESLRYAQVKLGLGSDVPHEGGEEENDDEDDSQTWSGVEDELDEDLDEEDEDLLAEETKFRASQSENTPRHLTGQELCEAIRLFAQEQFGLMAKCVLNSWGVHCTGDFGEIVYNLIRIEEMRKTESDRREDFDDVYDFEEGLVKSFKITAPRKS